MSNWETPALRELLKPKPGELKPGEKGPDGNTPLTDQPGQRHMPGTPNAPKK